MKNNSNIYDIDGKLIRAAGNNSQMTVKEAQEKIEYYRKKLEEVGENDKKAPIYATYMRNLTSYILQQYSRMTKQELQEEIDKQNVDKSTKEQIEKAIKELKDEVEGGDAETVSGDDESGVDDTVVEQAVEQPSPTIMDEYVQFEELPASDEASK